MRKKITIRHTNRKYRQLSRDLGQPEKVRILYHAFIILQKGKNTWQEKWSELDSHYKNRQTNKQTNKQKQIIKQTNKQKQQHQQQQVFMFPVAQAHCIFPWFFFFFF